MLTRSASALPLLRLSASALPRRLLSGAPSLQLVGRSLGSVRTPLACARALSTTSSSSGGGGGAAAAAASSSADADAEPPRPEVIWQLRDIVDELPEPLLRAYGRENMSQGEHNKLDLQAAIRKWQRFPRDTGSGEVQVAIATERIRQLSEHMKRHHKDMAVKRRLQLTVHKRNRMLK